jgi:uncharacterized membrane protein YhaH (DUF805 family)
MDFTNLLFGFGGRINRAKYWLAVLLWMIAWGVALAILFAFGSSYFYPAIGLIILIGILGLVSGIAVGIKRLHDRNKSGWWLLLFYLLPAILQQIAPHVGPSGFIFSIAGFAISVWMIVELGCLRGTAGPNEYGPDPLGATAAQAA